METEFLTFKDLQALFKVSRATLYRFIKRGMPLVNTGIDSVP